MIQNIPPVLWKSGSTTKTQWERHSLHNHSHSVCTLSQLSLTRRTNCIFGITMRAVVCSCVLSISTFEQELLWRNLARTFTTPGRPTPILSSILQSVVTTRMHRHWTEKGNRTSSVCSERGRQTKPESQRHDKREISYGHSVSGFIIHLQVYASGLTGLKVKFKTIHLFVIKYKHSLNICLEKVLNTNAWTKTAQKVQRPATAWTVRGSNPGTGKIFRTPPHRPWGHPSLPHTMYRVTPGAVTTHPI